MERFENKLIKNIHVSRWISSWERVGGEISSSYPGNLPFINWLRSEGLSNEEIDFIYTFATNGKMELERSARKFIVNLEGKYDDIYHLTKEQREESGMKGL